MGTLQRYILRSFLVSAGIAGLVLTFVLSVGFLFQVFQFILSGVSADLVLQYLGASLPEVLGFTIPLALMIASLLVFGRMSTDSEISAMKACGVSFFAIMRGPLIIAFLCSALGFYLQNYAMPRGHFVRRTIANQLALDAGVKLIEPGRFIDEIDNVAIFCDRKNDWVDEDGTKVTTLFNLIALDRTREDGVLREISAAKADMRADGSDLLFDLYDVTITPSLFKDTQGVATIARLPYRFSDVLTRKKAYIKKPKDMTFGELLTTCHEASEMAVSDKAQRKWHTRLRFLLNYRTVWALSSFCFVLVGIPLGCQSQRKESSRGMVLGLAVGVTFFLFILLSEALATKPAAFPWLLVWTPVALCVGAGIYLIRKHQ